MVKKVQVLTNACLSGDSLSKAAFFIDLEWWYFIGAGLLTMAIALLTVSFQSVKAALANPVESLRSESTETKSREIGLDSLRSE
jgi:ABC-type lipoprotein release transport system permease subunit